MINLTPKYTIIPISTSVFLEDDGLGTRIGGVGTLGGKLATEVNDAAIKAENAINDDYDVITDLINARLDTSTKTILGDFTFGVSGAIKMITDADNGLWISPTGILGKKAGLTTFAVDTDGNATFAGALSAATGTFAGSLTAVTGSFGEITTGLITLDNTGYVKGGQTAYDTGTGFFLGYSTDAYKFSLGNSSGAKMTWNGSAFAVSGATITGGTIQTASADQRIVISGSSNTLKIYNEDGTETVDFGTFGSNPILEISLNARTHNGITINGASDATSYGFEYLSDEDRASLALNIEMTSSNAANNLSAISVKNSGSGALLYGEANGSGKGIDLARTSGTGTSALLRLYSTVNIANSTVVDIDQQGSNVTADCVNITSTTKGKVLNVYNSNSSSENPAGYFKGSAVGQVSLYVDKAVGGGALEVNINANDGNRTYGIELNVVNAGGGTEYAFHFQGDEVNMDVSSVSTVDGVVKVYLPDGSAGYIPIYSSAS